MVIFQFFKMAAACGLGFVICKLGTTIEEDLMVFSVVQNFSAIGFAVLKIYEFQCYASLA